MSQSIDHLLLMPPNWLGDVVMAQPAMAAFAKGLTPARISVFGKPWLADILPVLGIPSAVFYEEMPLDAEVAVLFPNSFRSAWYAWRAGAKQRIGFRGQWRRALLTDAFAAQVSMSCEHHRDYYLDLAEQAGIIIDERQVQLTVTQEYIHAGTRMLHTHGLDAEKTIVVAPGARFGEAKRYPSPAYTQILTGFADQGWHILILGVEEERMIGDQCISGIKGFVWNASGQTTLRQGAELIAASRMLLSNDSGLMHLAAGMGKPVVALFGATDPMRTAPSGARVELIYHPATCSPCLQRVCSEPEQYCMKNITPKEVMDACLNILA